MLNQVKYSDRDGRERGFYLCRRNSGIVKGETLIGEEDVISDYVWEIDEAQCPPGTVEVGSFHTHPEGEAYPSRSDVHAANFDRHILTCIGAKGEVKCWNLLGKEYSPRLKTAMVIRKKQ